MIAEHIHVAGRPATHAAEAALRREASALEGRLSRVPDWDPRCRMEDGDGPERGRPERGQLSN